MFNLVTVAWLREELQQGELCSASACNALAARRPHRTCPSRRVGAPAFGLASGPRHSGGRQWPREGRMGSLGADQLAGTLRLHALFGVARPREMRINAYLYVRVGDLPKARKLQALARRYSSCTTHCT